MSKRALLSLTANGVNILAYVISDETLQSMKAMFNDKTIDPEYDSPLHMAEENAIETISVTKGLSEDGFDSGSLEVGSKTYQIDGFVTTSGDDSFAQGCEDYGVDDSDNHLHLVDDMLLDIGFNVKIPDGCHVIAEVIEFTEGEFACEFEVDDKKDVRPSDIKLIGYDLDVNTDVSGASYGVGLTRFMEHDLLGFEFDDEYYEFEVEIAMSSIDVHLISKGKNGQWEIDYDAEHWING